ncbi:hypothetical protein SUSAZ_00820 [Sulfolobus acidocaldarius SUSAZ]|nr:hypothetical protein SUSAZ_00820 [Sulfolobus acidocaldarius SUSAZ]
MELSLSLPTKRVYYYVLKSKNGVTIRQIQEDLGFSSTSAVRYHVKKLVAAGLVEETLEGKIVPRKVILDDDYMLLFNNILPKSVFFASFFLTSFFIIIFLISSHELALEVFSAIVVLIGGIVFVVDAIKRHMRFTKIHLDEE